MTIKVNITKIKIDSFDYSFEYNILIEGEEIEAKLKFKREPMLSDEALRLFLEGGGAARIALKDGLQL